MNVDPDVIRTGYLRWRTDHGTLLLVVYSLLIATIYPAFYVFTRLAPGNNTDSLPLRLISAGVSIALALLVWLVPAMRKHAYQLQVLNCIVFFVTLYTILVGTDNNVWYLAGDLLGIFGAQFAFVRRRDLIRVYTIAFAFDIGYSYYVGLAMNRIDLYTICVVGCASLIAVVSGIVQIRSQRSELMLRLRLEAQAQELRTKSARIAYLAYNDHLTGLPNRASMNDRIDEAMRDAAITGAGGALFYLDLDGFKQVNDRYGHDAGDSALAAVGSRLRSVLRGERVVARIGGDEFVVLSPATSPEDARGLVALMQGAFAEPFRIGDETIALTAAIGAAQFPQEGMTRESSLSLADQAMYADKRRSKGSVTVSE